MRDRQTPAARLGDRDNSLGGQVYEELRARITDGRLAPGERLIELVLAEEFGVSRVPVREALGRLVTEGIVTSVPRRGAVVTTLTRTDVEHLFDIREALEVLAFRLAAAIATDADIAWLRDIVARAEIATAADDHAEISRINTEFHEAIVDIAANPHLKTTLEPLMGRLRMIRGRSHAHRWQLREHTALIDAIAAHDVDRATAAALAHVRVSRSRTLAEFTDENGGLDRRC
ncbi:GntR family transcriptional regulator [Nocardia tengchongensis]